MAPSLCWGFKLSNEGSFVEIGQEMTKLGWKVWKKSLQSLRAELQSLRAESIAVCIQRWSFRRRSLSWETSFDWSEMKVRALPGVSQHPAVRTWPGFQIKWTQPDFSWFFMRTIPAAENRGAPKVLFLVSVAQMLFSLHQFHTMENSSHFPHIEIYCQERLAIFPHILWCEERVSSHFPSPSSISSHFGCVESAATNFLTLFHTLVQAGKSNEKFLTFFQCVERSFPYINSTHAENSLLFPHFFLTFSSHWNFIVYGRTNKFSFQIFRLLWCTVSERAQKWTYISWSHASMNNSHRCHGVECKQSGRVIEPWEVEGHWFSSPHAQQMM